jgi:hypothetical protein
MSVASAGLQVKGDIGWQNSRVSRLLYKLHDPAGSAVYRIKCVCAVTISALGIALDVAFVVKLDVAFFGSAATINNRVAFLPPAANFERPFTVGGGGKYRTIDG